jgi:hypothetical protein
MGFKNQAADSDSLLMTKKLDKDNVAPEVKGKFSIHINEKGTWNLLEMLI